MTIEEAQKKVDGWIRKYGVRYFSELTNMAVLTEEVGEVARIMSRRYGDQSFKKGEDPDALADELADVFWVLYGSMPMLGFIIAYYALIMFFCFFLCSRLHLF